MMNKLKLGLAVSALMASLVGCSAASDTAKNAANTQKDNVVIAYNNPSKWADWGTLHDSFKQKTGISVPDDNKNSGQTITSLMAEQSSPVADVAYYGIVFGPQAADKGLVEGYKPPKFDEVPASLKDPQGKWMAIHYGAVAFIVNKQVLGNTPVPASWSDLLKPEYKGKFGFLDPTSAAIGYSVATAANLAMGGTLDNWQPGIQYLQQLEKNGAIHPKATANAKVMKGEIPILIDADFNGYKMKYDDKAPIDVVIPKEGSLKIPYAISLVKNAPHQAAAKQYLDYVLSDEGQKLFAKGYVRPIRNVDIPAETKSKFLLDSDYARAKDVDYTKMNQVQAGFIEKWKSQVTAG
ncbi:extracellular solute-binding protein [Aneurinibacillus sp. Ricciae_BoGa-3]|uniref:extracellular solute-binding protein n=1 Tax=Aneurinibacillus sp. Ricciae_BoGa-3 TaxID=3022697 RepID=UPI002342565A|nr:extracellular solute-binding protein [Aneurinibacillus sp. Ricciae_BoGa-3]WCK54325.1 extracellular solute-binding protein [Aneurinibacillus sp. Ricciae_BoGa-3]